MHRQPFQFPSVLLAVLLRLHPKGSEDLKFESIELKDTNAPITLELAYHPGASNYSSILFIGTLHPKTNQWEVPSWSTNLINEGFMLAAFRAKHPPDPDPARRP